MQTIITEYKAQSCIRCSGKGFLSSFQYHKGGECFRCGATGVDPAMKEVSRDMTDAEIIAALETVGFPIIRTAAEPTGESFLDMLFPFKEITADEIAGARLLLAAV